MLITYSYAYTILSLNPVKIDGETDSWKSDLNTSKSKSDKFKGKHVLND